MKWIDLISYFPHPGRRAGFMNFGPAIRLHYWVPKLELGNQQPLGVFKGSSASNVFLFRDKKKGHEEMRISISFMPFVNVRQPAITGVACDYFPSSFNAVSTIFSVVNPYRRRTSSPGADAPKVVTPMAAPADPT